MTNRQHRVQHDDRSQPAGSGASSASGGFLADGSALGASALLTALAGLVGWLVAARTLSPSEVGHASAFVNAFLMIAALSELGTGQAMLRWLPRTGSAAPVLVRRVYAVTLATCLVLSVVWALSASGIVGRATDPLGRTGTTVLFVVAGLAWTLFHLQDDVLTGAGAARWVPLENLLFGAVRIVLLLVLAGPLGSLGIVLSWVLPMVLCDLLVNGLLALRSSRLADRPAWLPRRREVLTTTGSTFAALIGLTLLYNLVPLVVVARFGAATGAVFFVVWMGVVALDLAIVGFGNALVVRLHGAPLHLLRHALTRVLAIFAVPLLVAALAASPLLNLFGEVYARDGRTLLRWLVLGVVFRLVVMLVAAIHLGAGRPLGMALLQGVTAVAVIALAALVPRSGAATELAAIGIGFVLVHVVVAVVAVADLGRR
jgi:O-antigen/teichoic acid export membrane protein